MDLDWSIDFAVLLIDVKLEKNIGYLYFNLMDQEMLSMMIRQVKVHLDLLYMYNNAWQCCVVQQ